MASSGMDPVKNSRIKEDIEARQRRLRNTDRGAKAARRGHVNRGI